MIANRLKRALERCWCGSECNSKSTLRMTLHVSCGSECQPVADYYDQANQTSWSIKGRGCIGQLSDY